MSNLTSIQNGFVPISLAAFHEQSKQGEALNVSINGQDFKLLALGNIASTDGSTGRSVAWVQGQTDTTTMFLQALSGSYGSRLSSAVAGELGLVSSPGKALSSRTVQQACEMAQTGQQALSGVDFLTRLEHSAVAAGNAFKSTLKRLDIDAQDLNSAARASIDARMSARFDAAAGQSPLDSRTVSNWLVEELQALGLGKR